MSDPMTGEPSPEELQAYLSQLREADVAEVVVQAFNMLATGAQVKLGRRDARAVIDGLDALVSATAGALEDELAEQMRSAVGQLKAAQVQAEAEGGSAGPAGARGETATSSAGGPSPQQPGAAQPGPGGPAGASEGPGADERLTDRLWVPGRGPSR